MKKIFSFLVLLLFLLCSCAKDDDSRSVRLAVSDREYTVYNGQAFEIILDVYDPNLVLNKRMISIYTTRSTSTTSGATPENRDINNVDDIVSIDDGYSVVSVEPFESEEAGGLLRKWVVTVKEIEGRPHLSTVSARISVNQTGCIGAEVFSCNIEIESIPELSIDEIDFGMPDRVSYFIPNDEKPLNPALVYIRYSDMMLEGLAFDVDWISEMKAELLPKGSGSYFTIEKQSEGLNHSFLIMPSKSAFASLNKADYPVEANVRFTITDIVGGVIKFDKSILFYNPVITIPASESGLEVGIGFDKTILMKDILAKAGITKDYLQGLAAKSAFSLSIAYSSEYEDGRKIKPEPETGPKTELVFGLAFDETLYGESDIMKTDDFEVDVFDLGIPESGTYYAVFTVGTMDPLTLRPMIMAVIKLEIIYTKSVS